MTSIQGRLFIIPIRLGKRLNRWDRPIQDVRPGMEKLASLARPPRGVSFQAVDAGGAHAEWAIPGNAVLEGVLLYFHGGGFVYGSVSTHRSLVAQLALAGGVRALSVNYRLAPEHIFPAALEDCLAAYRWLLTQGISPQKIVLGGDSAGGQLVLTVLLALREAGDPLPAGGFCISPLTDMTGSGESRRTLDKLDPMLSHKAGKWLEAYIADPQVDVRQPLLSPLFADLHGLPPLLLHVGTLEILLDDSRLFVQAARQAVVDVRLKVWPGMWHVFQVMSPYLPEAKQAVQELGEFVRERLGARSSENR
jgi:monoterpene epsilon-lactone hydrolase